MRDCVKNGLVMLAMLYMTCDCHHLRNIIRNPYFAETWHYPGLYTRRPHPDVAKDTVVPETNHTPDFRLEEPYYTVYDRAFFREYNRPYRLSPHLKQTYWFDHNEKAWLMGCYCCTVYKRLHILATCAMITQRHILTTATSTDVVLRNFEGVNQLTDILGIQYERNQDTFNTTLYHPGPSRIHYHPKYQRDYEGNISHPIPCLYDLAVWSGYWTFGCASGNPAAYLCQRAGSTWSVSSHTIPRNGDRVFAVGFLFMKAFGRRPMPWFRYGVRSNQFIRPCPKSDWHWFHCLQGEWARLGMDSGGALHLMDLDRTGRNDGLSGMCAFSLKLRSKDIIHYYTVLDTHPVLNFLYDAYMGYQRYEFLDSRFYDWQGGAPRILHMHHIAVYYNYCTQPWAYYPPNYRKR